MNLIYSTIAFFTILAASLHDEPPVDSFQRINTISFVLQHSRRIPNNRVEINILRADSSARVSVKTKPLYSERKWENTPVDTVFTIELLSYYQIEKAVTSISAKDIETAFVRGYDGITCTLGYGDRSNSVSYTLWSPNYKTKERRAEDFLQACELIIRTARLKPSDIM